MTVIPLKIDFLEASSESHRGYNAKEGIDDWRLTCVCFRGLSSSNASSQVRVQNRFGFFQMFGLVNYFENLICIFFPTDTFVRAFPFSFYVLFNLHSIYHIKTSSLSIDVTSDVDFLKIDVRTDVDQPKEELPQLISIASAYAVYRLFPILFL